MDFIQVVQKKFKRLIGDATDFNSLSKLQFHAKVPLIATSYNRCCC